MNKINWAVRFKNPLFVAQLVMSIVAPIVGYLGINVSDLTSWQTLGDVLLQGVSNPYVVALVIISVYNAVIDPTTKGHADSERVINKGDNING